MTPVGTRFRSAGVIALATLLAGGLAAAADNAPGGSATPSVDDATAGRGSERTPVELERIRAFSDRLDDLLSSAATSGLYPSAPTAGFQLAGYGPLFLVPVSRSPLADRRIYLRLLEGQKARAVGIDREAQAGGPLPPPPDRARGKRSLKAAAVSDQLEARARRIGSRLRDIESELSRIGEPDSSPLLALNLAEAEVAALEGSIDDLERRISETRDDDSGSAATGGREKIEDGVIDLLLHSGSSLTDRPEDRISVVLLISGPGAGRASGSVLQISVRRADLPRAATPQSLEAARRKMSVTSRSF